MKKFYTLLCTVLFTVALVAQAPQKISYQKISGITSIGIRNLDTIKLGTLNLKTSMDSSKHNNQLLKKIKPYISNKTPFYGTEFYKVIATIGRLILLSR